MNKRGPQGCSEIWFPTASPWKEIKVCLFPIVLSGRFENSLLQPFHNVVEIQGGIEFLWWFGGLVQGTFTDRKGQTSAAPQEYSPRHPCEKLCCPRTCLLAALLRPGGSFPFRLQASSIGDGEGQITHSKPLCDSPSVCQLLLSSVVPHGTALYQVFLPSLPTFLLRSALRSGSVWLVG